jgi:uncharacterized phage protein gp47/JayE
MANLINKKTREQIVRAASEDIIALTDLTSILPNSTVDGIIRSIAARLSELYENIEVNFHASYLTTATGPYLDALAEDRGLIRQIYTETQIPCTTDSIFLKTKDGSPLYDALGILPATKYALFPRGILVTSSTSTDVVFESYETSAILPDRSTVSLGLSASLLSGQIIPEGTLDQVDFSNSFFTGTDTANLEILHAKTINGIQSYESDQSLRFRISNHLATAAGGNEAAIRAAVLAHPEVSTVQIERNIRGTGSFDVIVFPRQNRISSIVLKEFEESLRDSASFGEDFRIREPHYVPVSVQLAVIPEYRAEAKDAIENYVKDTKNKVLSFSSMSALMVESGIPASVSRISVNNRDILPATVVTLLTTEMYELRPRISSESAIEFI